MVLSKLNYFWWLGNFFILSEIQIAGEDFQEFGKTENNEIPPWGCSEPTVTRREALENPNDHGSVGDILS